MKRTISLFAFAIFVATAESLSGSQSTKPPLSSSGGQEVEESSIWMVRATKVGAFVSASGILILGLLLTWRDQLGGSEGVWAGSTAVFYSAAVVGVVAGLVATVWRLTDQWRVRILLVAGSAFGLVVVGAVFETSSQLAGAVGGVAATGWLEAFKWAAEREAVGPKEMLQVAIPKVSKCQWQDFAEENEISLAALFEAVGAELSASGDRGLITAARKIDSSEG